MGDQPKPNVALPEVPLPAGAAPAGCGSCGAPMSALVREVLGVVEVVALMCPACRGAVMIRHGQIAAPDGVTVN